MDELSQWLRRQKGPKVTHAPLVERMNRYHGLAFEVVAVGTAFSVPTRRQSGELTTPIPFRLIVTGVPMNLFLDTLSTSGENHLTAFFAAALELCPTVREAYAEFVLGAFAHARGWESCRIEQVETQVPFGGTTCCPDMLLTLSNGKKIVCEHKLESHETLGPECDERGQLERYLDLPVDGLIYVRTTRKAPAQCVLDSLKYVRPATEVHFLWRDFYGLLARSDDRFIQWLREGFDTLGLRQPRPVLIPQLQDMVLRIVQLEPGTETYWLADVSVEFTLNIDLPRTEYPVKLTSPSAERVQFHPTKWPGQANAKLRRFFGELGVDPAPEL